MTYTVENTWTEKTTKHRTWEAAFTAAAKHAEDQVLIHEHDKDGTRTYNQAGELISRDD